MICSKCGTKVNEGDTICTNCKAPLQVVAYEFDVPVSDIFNMNNWDAIKSGRNKGKKSGDANTDENLLANESKTNIKGKKKSAIVAAFAGIILIASALVFVISVSEDKRHNVNIDSGESINNADIGSSEDVSHSADKGTIDDINNSTDIDSSGNVDSNANQPNRTLILNEDIFEFTFSKYNGYGTPYVSMDVFKVYDALLPTLGFAEVNIDTRPVMTEIYEHINITFSENSNLSNDQVITAYISVDETCLEEHNIDFEITEYQIVVNGLKEVKNVDLFENLYVNVVENDGVNSVTWEYHGNDSFVIEQSFECHPDGGLNYGDKFVLSISPDQSDNLKQLYGINPVTLEKEYILLENKYEYLSDCNSVSDRLIENIMREDIKSMQEKFRDSAINIDKCKSVGGFIYRFEDWENSDYENCLVFIYELKEPYGNAKIGSLYVWAAHFDIAANPYGLQTCLCDDVSMGYSSIVFNLDNGSLESAGAQDAVNKVVNTYNMQEERISYNTELRLYLRKK